MVLGGLFIAFAAFQLWGTGVLEWRAQRALDTEFDALLAGIETADPSSIALDTAAPTGVADGPGPVATVDEVDVPLGDPSGADLPVEPELVRVAADPGHLPPEGAPIARIDIPAIGVRKTIVQGVDRSTLRSGPGHYPTTPLPGQRGNVAIAGHRTTHGAPFLDLDRLQPGDHIDLETVDGVYRYEVQEHRAGDGTSLGHVIVDPSDVGVIADQGDNRLTLTACHPRYSARQRIIVTALLVDEPSPEPVVVAEPRPTLTSDPTITGTDAGAGTGSTEAAGPIEPVDVGQTVHAIIPDSDGDPIEESLGWRPEELDPTVLWAVVTALVAFAGWVAGRLWQRRWAYGLTAPVAAIPLFVCFVHLDRLLPAF